MKKILSFLVVLSIYSPVFSQIGIGGIDTPGATLDIVASKTDGTTSEALIPPRLTGDQLASADANYGNDQNSVIVYVTKAVITPTSKTKNILNKGYYSYDSTKEEWSLIGAAYEPWFSDATNLGATSNTENVYQNGQVGIGINPPFESAQLEIFSSDKGISLPSLSTSDRNNISAPSNSLFIYNATTKCFNYYNATTSNWLSLCGDQGPAIMDIINCDAAGVGPKGVFRAGVPINYSLNTYTVIINVTKIGSYQVVAKTSNGYSFNKSGQFTSTGFHTIVLEGQGKPINAGINDITLSLNDQEITPLCTLPPVTVLPSEPTITIYCPGIQVNGNYLTGIDLTGTNTVTIPITEVVTPGDFNFSFTSTNGYQFSYSGAITAGTTSITLTGSGAPLRTGTDTLNLTFSGGNIVGATACSINIPVGLGLGGFNYPANRCLDIYTKSENTALDGEYWVKTSSTNTAPIKTFCDMTNGGYTLIWSYSEKTAYTGGGIYGTGNTMVFTTGLNSNNPQNVVNTEGSTITTYNNYRLSTEAMLNARSTNPGDYRVRISYKPTDMKDLWGINNYMNPKPTSGYDYISNSASTCAESLVPTTGKIFGLEYDGRTNSPTYNGVPTLDVCPYVNITYGPHWDAGTRIRPTTLTQTTLYREDGTSYPYEFYPNDFNNIFGWHGETEINHHFGKCVNGVNNDDYTYVVGGGATRTCGVGTAKQPHSFNNGEGRYLQWFVK